MDRRPGQGPAHRGIGPFRFDAVEYEAEIHRAHQERDWETREERIARLVTYACRDQRGGRPLSFGWASASQGHLTVYFQEWRPNPRAGDTTEYPDGTVGFEYDELWDNHPGYFEVPDLEDGAAVDHILEQIRSVPPARWRRPPNWPYS